MTDKKVNPFLDEKPEAGEAVSRRTFLRSGILGAAALSAGCAEESWTQDSSAPVDSGTLQDAALDATNLDASPGADAAADATTDAATDAADGGPVLNPFVLGVAAGDASATEATLWCKYIGQAQLRARLWRASTPDVVLLDEVVTPDTGGFVHHRVNLPEPGIHYGYDFVERVNDVTLPGFAGRFRAAFAEGVSAPLTIAAVSCTFNGRSFRTLEHAGSRTDLDMMLYLGDTTYADGATTAPTYAAKWHENLVTTGYRRLRSATGAYATWDDHEVGNNWNAETLNPAQIQLARNAFFDHQPIQRLPGTPDRIWRSHRWGRTAEIFVLDSRGERRPSTRLLPNATYLSSEQLEWFLDALRASPCQFKVIINSVPITNFPIALDVAANDRWEGYAAQRNQVLRTIENENITGVFWVAGDFHFASFGRVGAREGELGYGQWEALAGPGAQTPNPAWRLCNGPQFTFASGDDNYTVFSFNPTTGEVTARWHDANNDVLAERTVSVAPAAL